MTREAQSLSDSIVVLARTLQMRADYVRELALSISHELKTPLTGIRGSTELLRDHLEEMSAEERARFLSNILADTERLERLVRRILELARADALMPSGKEAAMSWPRQKQWQRARDVRFPSNARRRHCRLPSTANRSTSCCPTWSRTPASTAGRRPRYASPRALSRAASSSTYPTTGAAYRRPTAERMFDRFFTTARESGGTGLGLAIVRQRIAAFGGDISLRPAERGAAFRIRLRAASQTHTTSP